ncbi:MAG: glycosyltransferase involved in cell wall biosynthesis [Flavobacteriales bacterium]|jgi:glycosyltransferase involved in cell wall biosynthesis
MENNSLVSIIVPCYNQGNYLDAALQSVLAQTHHNWECIIVNDGSTDDTDVIARNWVEKDSRFVYFKKDNGGLSSARNLGLENAKGSYIQFLDSDDCIATTKLEHSLKQLNLAKNEGVNMVISNFKMFVDSPENATAPYCNLNEQMFNFENVLYQWEKSFTIPIHSGLFKSSLFKEFRFPENLKAKEDWVMWVSLFHKGCSGVFINESLAFYRINPKSMTMTKDLFPDFIQACIHFKSIFSEEEYQNFSIALLTKYYKSNEKFKYSLNATKNSNTYQTGLMIKKVLKTLGILKPFKKLFPFFLKLKSK